MKNLLVLCAASDSAPTYNCKMFLAQLRERGASIQVVKATADAALTRNNQAGLAAKLLEGDKSLDWVLWLDWDMSAAVDAVSLLMVTALSLAAGDTVVPNVSGSYVNRHSAEGSSLLSAFAIKQAQVVVVTLETERKDFPSELSVVPALTGMGCLLQHRSSFLAHCIESEQFTYPKHPDLLPCVCQPHVSHASEMGQYLELKPDDESLYWIGEDFDYCMREFDMGRPVYVSPVQFGHDSVVRLMPDSSTIFPGLRQPSDVVDS